MKFITYNACRGITLHALFVMNFSMQVYTAEPTSYLWNKKRMIEWNGVTIGPIITLQIMAGGGGGGRHACIMYWENPESGMYFHV